MIKTMNKREAMKSYILGANLLPERLWRAAFSLSEEDRICAEEFRLRVGKPFSVVVNGVQKNIFQDGQVVITYAEDIENVIAKATECSFHSWEEQVRQGFITVKGGHRIGLCGRVVEGGKGSTLTALTSLNIRIAKQMVGIGDRPTAQIAKDGFKDTLVVSPPGIGKTTLLRDMSRLLSKKYRVCIADCRFELGGSLSGAAAFDLGMCDIVQGGSKSQVIDMLLRAMSPQIIVVDEITSPQDASALLEASYTGCGFLASAHGACIEEMSVRPIYKSLMESGMFKKILLLEKNQGMRRYRIFERSGDDVKAGWHSDDNFFMLGDGDISES